MTGPIEILSTETCAWCIQLKKFLDYKGIPYTVRMIDEDADTQREIGEKFGFMSVPVTIIGDRWIQGYKPDLIMEALGNE